MRNSTRLAIEIGAVLIVGIAAFFVGRALGPGASLVGSQGAGSGDGGGASSGPTPPAPITARENVPGGIKVPEPGASVASNIALPAQVSAAGPGTSIKKRTFVLTVSGDQLSPDTVIVREGDIAMIWFTATDKAYGFTQPDFGWGVSLAKGETKSVENQFTQTGKFTFYCQSCGGPAAGPRGYIIVVPKDAP